MTASNNLVPMVITQHAGGERAMDIYSQLLQHRIIDMTGGVDDMSCSRVRSSLLHLQNEDSEKDIDLYIDSPGGGVVSGMSVIDTMYTIRPKVNVYCTGMAASMGSVFLAAGTGTRYVFPHSRIMLHQVLGGNKGQVADMAIGTAEAMNLNTDIKRLFARITGKNKAELEKVMDRDTWFTAQEAIEFGLADELVPLNHGFQHDIDESEFQHVSAEIFK